MSGKDSQSVNETRYEALSALKEEIRRKYEKFAPWYGLMDGVPEVLGVRRLRRRLLQRASGKVLEIAAGTGRDRKSVV